MIETIDGLADNSITADEVERVRNQFSSGLERLMNDSTSTR